MLGTFIIGLREGLEAALVVSILATFLRRQGASLRAMWVGVVAAVLLSVAVGVTLDLVSTSLPQRAQEGMETVISAVAVVFVTSMIVWMSTHARGLKKDLEASAGAALRGGTVGALATMAFLAVLKEGFETSVFLLATFQASQSTVLAMAGAVLGLVCAAAIGVGIYHGGIRFNIGRFFTVTGAFLVFVAAGLVLSTFRTAHEAGWITIGQARTVDLSWLAPLGSVRSALVTGVLGIPADPRAIEVLAYLCFLVPVLAFVLWPRRWRPAPHHVPHVRLGVAGGLAATAVVLAVAVPGVPAVAAGHLGAAPLVAPGDATTPLGTASLAAGASTLSLTDAAGRTTTLDLSAAERSTTSVRGVPLTELRTTGSGPVSGAGLPTSLTIADLVVLGDGRVPVGIDVRQDPGPFAATWTRSSATTLWVTPDDVLVDGSSVSTTAVTLTGGGLSRSRTVSVDAAGLRALAGTASSGTTDGTVRPAASTTTGTDLAATAWSVAPDHATAVERTLASQRKDAAERRLYTTYLPLVLLVAALGAAVAGLHSRRRSRSAVAVPGADPAARPGSAPDPGADRTLTRSTSDAV